MLLLIVLAALAGAALIGRGTLRRLGRATGRAGRAFTKPRPAPDPPAPQPSEAEARSLLGVPPKADAETVRAAHARLIRLAHPDKGGTAGLAAQLNAARDRLLGGHR